MRAIYSMGGLFSLFKEGRAEAFFERAADVDCREYELMVFNSAHQSPAWYEGIARAGLSIPVVHARKQIGSLLASGDANDADDALAMFAQDASLARRLGASTVVAHLWGAPASDERMGHIQACAPRFLDAARKAGVTLASENVPCTRADGLSRLRELHETCPGMMFTIDARFAFFERYIDVLDRAEWLWPNVAHVHVSDFRGGFKEWARLGKIVHMGEGEVPFPRFFEILREKRYDGAVTIECMCVEDGALDVRRMNANLGAVRALIGGHENVQETARTTRHHDRDPVLHMADG